MDKGSEEINWPENPPKVGDHYSRLLVRRTYAYLQEMHPGTATYEDVAHYLGTTHALVESVLKGDGARFEKNLFIELATHNRQKLMDFVRSLIQWEREQRKSA